MQALAELYVNGEWLDPVDGGRREIRCPADGSVVTVVSEGSRADTVKAIVAARRAFDDGPWPRTPERERGRCWPRTADLMVRDRAAFARAESLDTGKRLVEAEYDVDDVVACFRYYAGVAGTDAGRVIDTGVARRHQPGRPRAGRRVRPDHAVELPAAADVVEGGARPCWPATRSCSSPAS